MKTKIKYIYKVGNWKDLYIVGEEVIFRGRSVWTIEKVIYNKDKNETSVKLIKA